MNGELAHRWLWVWEVGLVYGVLIAVILAVAHVVERILGPSCMS